MQHSKPELNSRQGCGSLRLKGHNMHEEKMALAAAIDAALASNSQTATTSKVAA